MKTNLFFRTLAAVLVIVMVFGIVPYSALADESAQAQTETASEEAAYILYEENFDSCTGRIDLTEGNNFVGAGNGWIYSSKSTDGYAYIENGKLYFAGSAYDVLYRDGGQTWGNYTVEADISYNTDNVGWAGLAYNVQSGTKFQKGSVAPAGGVGLNGYDAAYSGGWTNNDATLNKTTLTDLGLTNSFAAGQMRLKITVENTSAKLWLAQYTDGVLGSWVEAKSIDNIYEDAQTGSIGFMSSNGSLGSIIVDNIKVYSDSLVSFTEDFSEYEGVSLSVGENGGATGMGIYFSEGQEKYAPTAYVQDGRLYLDARSTTSSYEHLYFMTGMNWTDYTVEMDICEIGTSGWIGMLYRVEEPFSFQKTGIKFNGEASLYGFTGTAAAPQWHHNAAANKATSSVVPTAGDPYRLKIVVSGQSATLYAAAHNDDGTVNAYTEIMSANNLYEGHTTGSVGLMLCSGQTNLKAAWIDNVVVSRGADRMVAGPVETLDEVYISTSGSDDAAGTQDAPVASLDAALLRANDGAVIHIVDSCTVPSTFSWPSTGAAVTVTGGTLDISTMGAPFHIHTPATFDDVTLALADGQRIYCNGHKVAINETVTVSGEGLIFGGSKTTTVASTDLTVLSGTWSEIYGGGSEANVTGAAQVTVGGNVNPNIDVTDHTIIYHVFGGGHNGTVGTAKVTVNGGKFSKVYGGGNGAVTDEFAATNVTVNGGTIMGVYGGSVNGTAKSGCQITVVVNGGSIEQIFGGHEFPSTNLTGDINLYLNGGTVTRRVYGGCYNETSSLSFATDYHVVGNITLYFGDVTVDYSSSNNDKAVYGHSRYSGDPDTFSDENSKIVFTTETAYNTYLEKLKAQDLAMQLIMGSTSAADNISFNDQSVNLYTVTYVADGETVAIYTVVEGGSVAQVPELPSKDGCTGAWDHDGTNITADTVITAVYQEKLSGVANIYVPNTGIIEPPTVVQQVTDALPATSGRTPAVALMEIDENLNITGTGITVSQWFDTYKEIVIPAFTVSSQAEADALSAFLSSSGVIDAFVVADSENAALVKSVRKACPAVRGAIRFSSITDNAAALQTVNENLAYIAISEAPVDLETATYFHLRQRAIWCVAADTADMYQAIAAGWSGMISADTDGVYDLYESITDTTVTGQALPIAHRGEHINTPENTLEAFRSAVDNYGVLAVETDLRLTADGDIILDHDGSLDRTTDYENRTDVFTKGNLTSSYTVEELKQLNVDYMGGEYKLATFEEALAEFADQGLVFYAHINGSEDQLPGIVSRLEELLEKYDAYDNVVFFIGYAYHDAFNAIAGTVTDKISVTVGHTDTLTSPTDSRECVTNFINELAVDNCQPLFYNYGEHKGWKFYYLLSARGFVNSHSISNTQAYLDGVLLGDWGAVGVLTDDIHLTTDYVHKITAQDLEVVVGLPMDTTYDLVKTVGTVSQAECDFVQLSGPEMDGYKFTQAGQAQIVFYTTATAPAGCQYRVYSEPVTVTAVDSAEIVKWNISLSDDICPNFYLVVSDSLVSDATVEVSVGSVEAVTYNVSELPVTGDGYYVVSTPLAAAQMTDEIQLQVTAGEKVLLTRSYTVAQYGKTVLASASLSDSHALVKAMLNYGAMAQLNFNYNTDVLANAGCEQDSAAVPADVYTVAPEGAVEGLSSYGASLVYRNKIALRFYFSGDVTGCTFAVGENTYSPVAKSGMYFVEIPDIGPQSYSTDITLTVTKDGNTLSVTYSPMHYITRMYNKEGTDDALKALLAAMYSYHLEAKSYADAIVYISILGDSISTYVGVSNDAYANSTIGNNNVYYTAGRHDVYQSDTWWQQVIDGAGLQLLVNNSWSGSCILSERSGTVGAYIDRCVQLHNNAGTTPDIIAVFLGTNDFSHFPDTLGSAEAIDYATLIVDNGDGTYTYAEPTTSCEAYAVMLHKMSVRYPDAQILCMTLLARREDAAAGQPTAFNDDLKAIARRLDCTIVDLENCGIKPAADNYDTYMADWGVHPNTLGMDKISQAVLAVLQQDEVVAELNGKDLTLTSDGFVYDLGSDSWTLEGRLAIDFDTVPWSEKDYRVYAGADGFDQAVAVLYSCAQDQWYLQNQTTWENIVLTEEEVNLLNADNGGLWVRWIRSGSTLTLWISTDGSNWTRSVSHYGITGSELYIKTSQSLESQLLDTSFCTEAVFTEAKGTTMAVPADYTDASYAVFEANIKALDDITYDWGSNILISPSGAVWDAYDFQILYGTSSEQNLVKLTGATTTDNGSTAEQEQWVNDPAFEKIFSEEGMDIKAVRFNTWVYLLADMGNGYELVGRNYVPADQATAFSVFNTSTAIEISNYSVTTGEAAAADAMSGLDLELSTNYYLFPMTSDSWTLEGRLTIDTATFPWGAQDYRMYAGADGFSQAVGVYYNKNTWFLQKQSGDWSNVQIPDEEWWKLSTQSGGMWVRFEKSGSTLTASVSKDGETWTTTLSHESITEKGIYLYATLASELWNIKLTAGE